MSMSGLHQGQMVSKHDAEANRDMIMLTKNMRNAVSPSAMKELKSIQQECQEEISTLHESIDSQISGTALLHAPLK